MHWTEPGLQALWQLTVIASEAKQSSGRRELDCFVAALLAMTEAEIQ